MDRKVKLTILGLHMGMGDEEGTGGSDNGGNGNGRSGNGDNNDNNIETVVQAEYFKRNDSHYLLYEERMEGFAQPSRNRIKFKDNMLELTRQGLIHTHMAFEAGRKHIARYAMPYGELELGIDTKKVAVEETEDSVRVLVEYALEMDGEYLEESRIEILVQGQAGN